jgi:transposase
MEKKHPGGAPTKYHKKFLPIIAKLAGGKGYTNLQIAELLGISEKTVYNWQTRYPEFLQALKEGKAEVVDRLENSLYRSAEGYDTWEEVEYYNPEEKKWIPHSRKKKHIPGNATALIFSLCNLDKRWKRKQEIEVGDINIVIERKKGDEE